MANYVFELYKLKASLTAKGIEESTAQQIVNKAEAEIHEAMRSQMVAAEEELVAIGTDMRSADFINELRPKPGAFEMETASGNTNFSTPPYPMLANLLKGAKPIKDGSGVYKVIPIGGDGPKPSIAMNIYDVHKAQLVQQQEKLKAKSTRGAGAKPSFKTVTSKQDASINWVYPAQPKDFNEDISRVNNGLKASLEELVQSIIREYEENF